MTPSPAIKNLIGKGKYTKYTATCKPAKTATIMQTMNQSLLDLHLKGKISYEDMFFHSPEINELMNLIKEQNGNIER